MSTYRCAVAHCLYIAESSIDDFVVCALHDAPQTRGILERLQMPGAYWFHERPIVLPTGDLTEADLIKVEAHEGSIYAWQDKSLADVPDFPSRSIHPNFDLTRGPID
jgi:hypothetical protein